MKSMECRRCGNCCVKYGCALSATEEDIERWLTEKRYDILQRLAYNPWIYPRTVTDEIPLTLETMIEIENDVGNKSFEKMVRRRFRQIAKEELTDTDLWFDPTTGEEEIVCPFLRKSRGKEMFECLIHETKPYFCRLFFCQDPERMRFRDVYKEYKRRKASHRYYRRKDMDAKGTAR